MYVDDIKLAGKKQNLDPMWKVLSREVDLGEPTSFLDHMYLGCTQRQCETSKDIVDNYRTMSESRISAGGVEKLPFPQNLRISSWSFDMAGHAKKCVERYCELANKTTQQLYKVSTPCIDDHHFTEEETKSVGELSNTCSQILKCLNLARVGRPDILWSVNKLARSITKWTKACDKRLNRLISYIHHTCEYRQYCHVGNTAKECRLGLFKDNEAVVKMIIKGRSPTMRHVSRTYRVVLLWLFDRINLDTKIQIKYMDTKNQLTYILTQGNFTRDEWNHLLCFFKISHFSSVNKCEAMTKRTQNDAGEERVTAKSKPMMTRHESQTLMIPQADKYDRTVRPVVYAHSSSFSECDIEKTLSSQECKSDELMEDRTGPPVVNAQHTDRFIIENDEMNSHAEAESELSLGSRSLLRRVNDQVRKKQKQSDATKDSDKHSVIWRMFMSTTLQASVFMVKNYSDNWHFIKSTEDLTKKQMFDISETLKTIDWEDYSWKYLSLVGDEKVISLSHTNG